MTVPEQIATMVETQLGSIAREDYLRPSSNLSRFIQEHSELVAQASEDISRLSGAGFDPSQLPLFQASLKMLSVAHSARVQNGFDKSDTEIAFSNGMPAAKKDRVVLRAAAQYVVATSDDDSAKRKYDAISKGHSNIGILQGNLDLVKFLREYAPLAAQVRPAGVAITEELLIRVESNALELIQLQGEAATDSDDVCPYLERQQKLVTLCIRHQREIKLFARMAFCLDMMRYNKFYATKRAAAKTDDVEAIEKALPTETLAAV